MLNAITLLALLSAPARADTVEILGNSTGSSNCIPFGENYGGSSTVAEYHGFVYQNIDAFDLQPGDTIAFDLFAPNDNTIITDIAMSGTTTNGGRIPDASGFTTVVSAGTPADPDGNNVSGDFELVFTVDDYFSFGGGGLIIRFQAQGAFRSDTTCTQVLTHSSPSDTSGYFVGRVLEDADGVYPWDNEDDFNVGNVIIDWVGRWCDDADGDGYGDPSTCVSGTEPSGYVNNDDDCDDTDSTINPDGAEVCDGDDNDCDTLIDDDDDDTDTSGMSTFYADDDGDGFGDSAASALRCDQPSGYVTDDTDCDDIRAAVNPDADELCSTSYDDDCDSTTNEDDAVDAVTFYADSDSDGFGDVLTADTACTQPSGYVEDDTDCDDTRAAVNPDADEVCSTSYDDDCDGTANEDDAIDASTFYADSDGDGFGDVLSADQACTEPSGYISDDSDCDDTRAAVNPDADELCSTSYDDDCDGTINEDDAADVSTWYADSDSDGFGDALTTDQECTQPSGYVSDATDCDDAIAAVNPDADEVCSTAYDDDCDGTANEDDAVDASSWFADDDGDGYGDRYTSDLACEEPSGYVDDDTDCDDTDGATYPGASESADGVDNDCDGTVDEGTDYFDADGDGYAPAGGDCDDDDASINPGAAEVADGVDNNCDGTVDEGTAAYDDDGDGYTEDDGDCDDTDAAVNPGTAEVSDNSIDDDCDGVVDSGLWDEDGDGFLPEGGDCDDTDPDIYPGAEEIEDGIDNNCDGTIDEGTDAYDDDGDGLSENDGDCDDGSAARSPDGVEVLDGIDNDCDGIVDDGTAAYDDDGDGFSELDGDCDDTDPSIAPGAEELEDGVDNDCDSLIDEAFDAADGDGDGFVSSDDCDDSDGWVYPGAEEFCDGLDNDCDGETDEDEICGEVDVDTGASKIDGQGGCATAGGLVSTMWLAGLVGLVARRRRRAAEVLGVASLVGCAVETNVHSIEPVLESEILMLDLGDQTVGAGAVEATLSLQSTGSGRVTIDRVEIVDDVGEAFTVEGDWSEPIVPDTSAELTVSFAPEAVGWHRGALVVYSDAVDGPVSIELRGHALEALLGVWPPQLDFGPVASGESKEAVVTVFNDGRLPVSLTDIVVDGPFVAQTDATSLGAGEEAPITITFSPTDEAPAAGGLDIQFADVGSVSATLSGNDCALGDPSAYDQDGDGHTSCVADCDDSDASINPSAEEVEDGVDNNCDGTVDEGTDAYDDDGDGFSENDGDCDDSNSETYAGAAEISGNGIDDDCDGIVDDGRPDPDGDGFSAGGGDCDETDASIHPGAAEVADGVDNNCDGTIDEGTAAYDDDGDGYSEDDGDCDDSDASTSPDGAEVADWVDNDCDGTVDEGTDAYDDDGDGYTENGGDCDDTDASVSPADPEVLSDGIDNDCDGVTE